MKKLFSILPVLAGCVLSVQGQGYILFSNTTQDSLTEIRISDDTTSDYVGDTFVAQLFANVQGSIEAALVAIDSPVPFIGSDPMFAGLFLGNEIQIAGVAAGSIATMQLRVWAPAVLNESWDTAYAAALLNNTLRVGKSTLFNVTLGTQGSNVEMALYLPIFTVNTIPEDEVVALGILGLGLALIRRNVSKRKSIQAPYPASLN